MYSFQQEKLADILDEMKPLLEKHWKEVAWYQDEVEFAPDYVRYLQLEEIGAVVVVTVREEGELVGYNVYFINSHLHYSKDVYAVNDIIFLSPPHRHAGLAAELMEHTERVLESKGVSVVTMHMKLAHPFRSLMEECGFAPQEVIYSKYIGGSDGSN